MTDISRKAFIKELRAGWEAMEDSELERLADLCEKAADILEAESPMVLAPVQAPVYIEQIASERYKVVPSHDSMFHRWAVVAGDGTQQIYLGREAECKNMARKFAGAFLDGAYLSRQTAVAIK